MSIDSQADAVMGLAESALRSAREQASRIGVSAPNIGRANFNYTPNKPNIGPPLQFSDLFPKADTTDKTVRWLNGEVDEWIDKYFPELTMCLRTLPEEWLCGILSGNKEFGLDKTVFDIIWHRARDREYRASNTEYRTISNTFSSRGFDMPPGAFIHALGESERRASEAISEVNREQAVREAEIKLDLMKFAEEQAIRLKLGIMDAMRNLFVALMNLPDKELERARIQSQAMSAFYGAMSSYYNIELGFEQLRLRAAEASAGIEIDNHKLRVSNGDSGRNAALGAATQAFANAASGAASAGSAFYAEITTE